MEKTSNRDRVGKLLTHPAFVLGNIGVSTIIMVLLGGAGYLVGLGVVLISFWAIRWDWSYFGISVPNWGMSIFKALVYTLFLIAFIDVLTTPIIEHYTNTPHDLSGFEFLKGNLPKLLLFFLFMWIIAGFGEEFFYRGYIMKRLANLFGDTDNAWLIGAFLSAIPFGLVHFYQGVSGMVTTGLAGLVFGLIFFQNRNNLVVCMLTHGMYDMFGLTLIYLDKETMITDWAHKFLFSVIY